MDNETMKELVDKSNTYDKETVSDVINAMTEKQKKVVYDLIGIACGGSEGDKNSDTFTCNWAENECALAIRREMESAKADGNPDDAYYGIEIYRSALRAYNSLCKDGHTGMSMGFTHAILDKLIDHEPLTPIEDVESDWNYVRGNSTEDLRVYQNKRYSGLFKNVAPDGSVTFDDVNMVRCIDVDAPYGTWHIGFISQMVKEKFPITFPYIPFKVTVRKRDYLAYPNGGDYDTVHVINMEYFDKETGKSIVETIDKYFAESDCGNMIEIPKDIFNERVKLAEALEKERSK